MARGFSFKYRGRSSEEVSRRAKQRSGGYDSYLPNDITRFSSRSGENQIRVLPWMASDHKDAMTYFERYGDHWGIDIFLHGKVGPDEGQYLCLDKMKGERCPICEARRTGTEEERDAWRLNNRILCWVVDRKDEKAGPMLWAMPLGVSNDISAASQVKGSGDVLLIDDPMNGYDIFFDREGEKDRTKYKRVDVDRKDSPLGDSDEVQERWLQFVLDHPLPDLLNYYPADHIEKVLMGQVERGGDKGDPSEDRETDCGGSSGGRGHRGRGDEAPEREERFTRRGRDEASEREPERRDDQGNHRDPEPGDRERESGFDRGSRGSGRRGRDDPSDRGERDQEAERGNEGREAASEREPNRGRGQERVRRQPEEDVRESSRRGRDDRGEPARGEEPDDDSRSVDAARQRLGRIGRRG